MFYAARSGKQHLTFECLEMRHLLSADFGAVDFHDDLTKQAPAPAIIAIAPTAQMAGQVEHFDEFKGQVTASYNDHRPQQLTNHFGSFEPDDLETDDAEPDDYDRGQQQIVLIRTVQVVQISQDELRSLNASGLKIEPGAFKATPAQQVVIDYGQNDGDAGEVDEIEIDDISLTGIHEPSVAVAIKSSSPNIITPPDHSASNSTANFAMPIETATTQADESVASEQSASNLDIKSDRSSLPMNSPVVDGANPSQQPFTSSLIELEPVADSRESVSDFDAVLAVGADTDAYSAVAISADEGPEQIESSTAIASVQELVTDVSARVVPAARELIAAGLSGDFEAIDLAMSQLLHDLDSVRTDATLLLDETTLRGLASTAVVGVIAAEIVRRRMREKERLHQATIEEHLAIWMYPECSGVSSRPSL